MRKWLIVLFLLVSLNAWAGPGREALARFSEGLQSLEARFEQSVLDLENSRQGVMYGVFSLQRPDKFRWDYLAPEPRQIIADGGTLWIVEEDLEQITQYPQWLALDDSPAVVLLKEDSIDETFKVVEIGERLGMQWLELLPKDPEADTVRVLLAFVGNDLKRLELTDRFGQISRFSFFQIQRNPELDEALFRFEPPNEWDVFEY